MADEAAGDATTAPRRSSRRELTSRATSPAPAANDIQSVTVRVDSGGDEASTSSAAAAPSTPEQQSTRRSRRQVKSTYATHALASLSPTASAAAHATSSAMKDKKSGKTTAEPATTAVTTEENERITKRRRPNPSAGGAATKSPASEVQQVILVKVDLSSPHQAPQAEPVAVAVDAVPTAVPASPPRLSTASPAPNSANRRRRPVSRQQMLSANGNGVSDNSSNATSGIWSLTSALNAATPMGDADVSARTQQRKVLGKYTGRECTLLCEVILQQLKRNSMDPKALERDHSPAFIRWEKVAQKLLKAHRLTISPLDAQTLWKFLAYTEQPPAVPSLVITNSRERDEQSTDAAVDSELLPASDTEDFAQSVEKINEKYKSSKTKSSGAAAVTQLHAATENPQTVEIPASAPATTVAPGGEVETGVKEETSTTAGDEMPATESLPQVTKPISAEKQAQLTEEPTSNAAASLAATATKQVAPTAIASGSHFRLYPVYGLPTGIPESWQQAKPFNVKETLPLTFVAEKFLKKKPGAVQPPPATTTATVSPASCETGAMDPTASAVAQVVDSAAQEKPKKKRGRKAESAKSKAGSAADANSATTGAPGEPPAKKKPRASSQKSPASSGKTATPTPVRTPFVPSSTPPPQPLPPRAAFQFFCRMHEAESLAETFVAAASATTPETSSAQPKKKTYFELQELFASASLQVRNACQKLALEDLDRYNRECVRRRIWEKAMSNSPVASPAPTATALTGTSTVQPPQPPQPPQQVQQQEVSIPSLVVPVAITEVPALPTNSNPAAHALAPPAPAK